MNDIHITSSTLLNVIQRYNTSSHSYRRLAVNRCFEAESIDHLYDNDLISDDNIDFKNVNQLQTC